MFVVDVCLTISTIPSAAGNKNTPARFLNITEISRFDLNDANEMYYTMHLNKKQ